MSRVQRHWPIFILALTEIVLAVANYKPGTWLMGWDNVMPEFNFKQVLTTNLFGVWQEHRGLGLYDGMGHAANLIHTIFLWLLSLAIPTNLLRYTFHFLMHFLGGIGAYVLLKNAIDNNNAAALKLSISRWVALVGSLFYMFNLATIQMFYTPLEAFSVHFAALPWLTWSLIIYLHEGSRKKILLFLLISLLSTPQFFIPTLLLPVGILLGSIAFTRTLLAKLQGESLRRVITASLGFFLVNAFWLLPYVYGLPHNAPVITAAKINQMSSSEVFARNQAFGSLSDVLRLRGFPLDFEDIGADGSTTYLMAPWREFLQLPLVTLGSWFLVAITILGIGMNGFLVPFIASLLFMANDTVIIKEVTEALRHVAPILAEAFRFPFTKFSLLFAFSSSVLFTIGLARIAKIRIITIIIVGLIVILALPAFRGNFFSDRLRVALPDDYLRVFAFMKDKPLDRVAYLPQQQYWSWKYYRWGYRGSGFAWYGLTQPILDRAFDPWSGYNENYYWELSRSIYSKDAVAFDAVLAKYDVRYVLFDENIISPSHNRALFTEEIKAMLAALPEVQEVARFGNITVYEKLGDDSQSFVSLKTNLPAVSPAYTWTDNDVAYRNLGDYIVEQDGFRVKPGMTKYFYPFRSLFTKRSVDEREFTIEETDSAITLTDPQQATTTSILKHDALAFEATNSATLNPQAVVPCGIAGKGIALKSTIGSSSASDTGNQTIKPDQFLRFTNNNQRGCLSFDVPQLPHKDSYLVAVESRHVTGRPLLLAFINDTARHAETETYLDHSNSKKVKPFSLDKKDLTFSGQWQTDYFILPQLAPDGLGYTVYLSNDAIGKQETINDIKSIRFYGIPYQELVTLHSAEVQPLSTETQPQGPALSVDHPNPAFYKISFQPSTVSGQPEQTLILSQSFDPGWLAFTKTTTFPFLKPLQDHVLVNNWSNGWRIKLSAISCLPRSSGQEPSAKNNKLQAESCPLTAVIFFWPQLLEWIGFLLLPIPFMLTYLPKLFRPTHTLQST